MWVWNFPKIFGNSFRPNKNMNATRFFFVKRVSGILDLFVCILGHVGSFSGSLLGKCSFFLSEWVSKVHPWKSMAWHESAGCEWTGPGARNWSFLGIYDIYLKSLQGAIWSYPQVFFGSTSQGVSVFTTWFKAAAATDWSIGPWKKIHDRLGSKDLLYKHVYTVWVFSQQLEPIYLTIHTVFLVPGTQFREIVSKNRTRTENLAPKL